MTVVELWAIIATAAAAVSIGVAFLMFCWGCEEEYQRKRLEKRL